MRQIMSICLQASSLILLCSSALAYASPAYLKIDDIKGEATTTIEVESWTWGTSNRAVAPNQNSSRSNHTRAASSQNLPDPAAKEGTVSIKTAREAGSGLATGRLGGGCVQGTHFPTVKLETRNRVVTLSDVTVVECASNSMTLGYQTAEDLPVRSSDPAQGGDADRKATKSRSNIQNN